MGDNVLLWCVEKIGRLCEGSSFDLPPKKREKKRKKSSWWREPGLDPLTRKPFSIRLKYCVGYEKTSQQERDTSYGLANLSE
jgi:hypothetical protein